MSDASDPENDVSAAESSVSEDQSATVDEGPQLFEAEPQDGSAGADEAYKVLARKYRPSTFDDLIGQDAMVRTLTNAFAAGRIAQAYMLTGVRGVGKTTTARILARALNYEPKNAAPSGEAARPTVEMPSYGVHCEGIIGSHHPDVVEMDAASHTGIDDVREIIESVRYRPMSARYKVYIIDEVHMLSRQAFNGLLKTLEEPPAHARFIFATTEIRKVPVTVLSRCQRFDLARIGADLLIEHFRKITANEGAKITDEALALIARAAEGSARDGLSLLDQAIARDGEAIEADMVREMLGLADRSRVIDLFEAVMAGNIAAALDEVKSQYQAGADPLVILTDLTEFVHLVTRVKVVPTSLGDPSLSEAERDRSQAFAEKLDMGALTRAWQMLSKGLGEVESSPRPVAAADMVLVRLAYAANLPTPGEVIRRLEGVGDVTASAGGGDAPAPSSKPQAPQSASADFSYENPSPNPSGGRVATLPKAGIDEPVSNPAAINNPAQPSSASGNAEIDVPQEPTPWDGAPNPSNFAEAAGLVGDYDIRLAHIVETSVRPVKFAAGHIEVALADDAPRDIAFRFGRTLERATGRKWMVAIAQDQGGQTLREKRKEADDLRESQAAAHPVVQAVMNKFPGAKIVDIREPEEPDTAAEAEPQMDGDQKEA